MYAWICQCSRASQCEDDYVQLIIDKEVAEGEWFVCNTGVNTTHLKFKTQDLLKKFLPYTHHRPRIVDL